VKCGEGRQEGNRRATGGQQEGNRSKLCKQEGKNDRRAREGQKRQEGERRAKMTGREKGKNDRRARGGRRVRWASCVELSGKTAAST
jgi:hypothetical protein